MGTSRRARLGAIARLARELGPWASPDRVAPSITSELCSSGPADGAGRRDEHARVRVHRPVKGAPIGAIFVIPGLHQEGPDERRLARFLAALSAAGFVVGSPFLPDFQALWLAPSVVDDCQRAFALFTREGDLPVRRPGVMSISFGSLPALRLAASDAHGKDLAGLVTFGGYADFEDALRFSIAGRDGRPHDPLNRPVVFINLLQQIDAGADFDALHRAWLEYTAATWGRPEMKARERYEPVARAIAARLPQRERELFLLGTGLAPGGLERALAALDLVRDQRRYLDPRPHLDRVRCDVYVVHGLDDDVIPATHADQLREALRPHTRVRTLLTGVYGHASAQGLGVLRIARAAREARTMLGMLEALVDVSTRG